MACVHTTLTKQPVPEIQENKYYSNPKTEHLAVSWTYKNTKNESLLDEFKGQNLTCNKTCIWLMEMKVTICKPQVAVWLRELLIPHGF